MTEDFAENFAEKTIHLLMRAAADYSEIFQDIRASWDAQYDGAYTLVHNDEAYPDSDSTTLDGWLSLARKLVLGVSLMMQCMIYASLIEKRLPSCRYFWQLGASRSRILAMTLREGVELWLFVLPAGILAACTITARLVPVIGNFLESEVVWAFSWRNLLFSAAYGTAVSAVGLLIPSLRLPFLLDGEKPEQSSQNKDRKGRFASRRKLSSWRRRLRLSSGHFLLRRWRMYPWRTAASFVLTMLILAVSVFTVRGIYAQLQNLYFEERGYGGDYEFISYGEMVNEEGVWGIPLEKLSALAGVYGISEVRAYTITEPEIPESRRIETVETEDGETQAEVLIPDELCGGFTVDLQESANDEYFLTAWEEAKSLEIAEDAAVEKASADAYPIDIYGCRTESELKRLSESLSEGELRSETFMSGDEVILYVPPYRNGRSYKYETYFAKSGEVTNGETVRQQRIRPGDSLTLSYTNPATGRTQEKTVTVAGLIETWKDENAAQPLPDSTYTVITGGEFFDAFPDFVPGQYCQYVGICLDGTQDINSLEKILRPYLQELVSWHVNMTSSGKRLREVREETLSTISFYLFFGGYLIFLFLFLLMRLMRTDAQSRESETEILRSLGMEKRSLRRISLAASGIYAALSAALGMVLFPALCYWQRLQTVRLQLAEGNEAAMESLAWRWNMDFPLAWYGWIALILIFLSMLWGYLPSPEVKKEE